MPTMSDSESELDIHSKVVKAQKTMTNVLNSSLQKFSSIYKASSINAQPLPSNDIEHELETIAGDDEDWWTPRNNKRRPESRSPISANKVQRNSTSPKTTEPANRFAELSDMDTTKEYLQAYQTTSQLVNNLDQASTSTGLSHGCSGNNNNVERNRSQSNNNSIDNATNKHPPNHKPPPIPSPTNKEIHEVKTLCRQRVQVELPYKKDDVVQCHRCQDFHHTKNNCFLDHNSNYKNCDVYQQTVRRRKNLSSQGNALPQKTSTKRTSVRSDVVGALSYANVTNGHSRHQNQQGGRSQLQQHANLHQNQFPPLGTSKRDKQHKPNDLPRLRTQTIQTTDQQQYLETRHQQQQSFQQQHQRNHEQFQNDQQWKRQGQMYLRSEEQLSDLVARFDKMLQMMMSMMSLITNLLPQIAPGSAQAAAGLHSAFTAQP
ncbi:putative transcriptional regulator cudA [Drosophila suzukii]|uniref:Transcriptional regulator cudA n=1 Tax=Drosophila suzukii TaxID=28584 RepID=A0ABM4TXE7_DROSZ